MTPKKGCFGHPFPKKLITKRHLYLGDIIVLATSKLYTMMSVSQDTWSGFKTSGSESTPLGVVQCGHLCRKSGDSGSPCNAFRFEEQSKICTIGVLNVISKKY